MKATHFDRINMINGIGERQAGAASGRPVNHINPVKKAGGGKADQITGIDGINGIGGRETETSSLSLSDHHLNHINPVKKAVAGPLPHSVHSVVPRNSVKNSPVERVARALARHARQKEAALPRVDSFLEFLTTHARVKSGSGYAPYHFKGREALRPIVQQIDALLLRGWRWWDEGAARLIQAATERCRCSQPD